MNLTYYNKIKKLNLNDKEKIDKIIDQERNNAYIKSVNSCWGITKSLKQYSRFLKLIKICNKLPFKNISFKLIYKIVENVACKKIRVLFILNEYFVFPSFKSVYDEMVKDDDFICDLVYVPFIHVNKERNDEKEMNDYINHGYKNIINYKDYDLANKSPDVVIYLKPYDSIPMEFCVHEIKNVSDYIIYIPYGIHAVSDEEIFKYSFKLPIQDIAWKVIAGSKKTQELAEKYSKQKGKNFDFIGHPRLDLINENYSDDEFYKKIKKMANGRKIFFYSPHHTIADNFKWGTFKLYGLDLLRYFSSNKDLFLIYRPHPLLNGALDKEYKNDKNFRKTYEELLKSENILYDDTGNYLIAMHISDYLISDASSLVSEFTMYNKPVIYTEYPGSKKIDDSDLESMIYTANNFDELKKYIVQLKEENDSLKKVRSKGIIKYFKFDKNRTVASKIIEKIKKEFKG